MLTVKMMAKVLRHCVNQKVSDHLRFFFHVHACTGLIACLSFSRSYLILYINVDQHATMTENE